MRLHQLLAGVSLLLCIKIPGTSCSVGTAITSSEFVCICPSIRRPICGYTSTGIITQFDNLCSLKCEASRNKDFKFSIITPYLCKKGVRTLDGKSEEAYLKEWKQYIEEEINFWKPIEQSLDVLLSNSVR